LDGSRVIQPQFSLQLCTITIGEHTSLASHGNDGIAWLKAYQGECGDCDEEKCRYSE